MDVTIGVKIKGVKSLASLFTCFPIEIIQEIKHAKLNGSKQSDEMAGNLPSILSYVLNISKIVTSYKGAEKDH